jgi:hypothetical protein
MPISPPPWRMTPCRCGYPTCNQWFISVARSDGRFDIGDARLICAAPELLAALRGVIESLNVAIERNDGDTFGAHHNQAMDNMAAAERAIARATT